MENRIDPGEVIADKFKFLWEQYTKVVNLLITLSTGALLVLCNMIASDSVVKRIQSGSTLTRTLGLTSAVFIFMGLISAVVWRIYCQGWMEIEVFGDKTKVTDYLRHIGVHPDRYGFQVGPTRGKRLWWLFSQWAAGIFLSIGLVTMLVFGLSLILQ